MRDRSVLLNSGAVTIAAVGFWIELRLGYDAFARSGSLIVIYGIVMVGWAFRQAELGHARNEARFEKLEAAYLDASTNGDKNSAPDVFSRLSKVYADLRTSRLERENRLLINEVWMVCIGTLIWGFGDLFVDWVRDGNFGGVAS